MSMTKDEKSSVQEGAMSPLRSAIVVVEDDMGLANLIGKALRRGLGVAVLDAGTGTAGMELAMGHPEVLLLIDYSLPDMSAADVVQTLRKKGQTPEFIVITGRGDEQVAVEMMKAGARDYFVKDAGFLDRLPRSVERVLQTIERDRRIKEAQIEIREHERRIGTLMGNLPGMAYRCRNCRAWSMEIVSEGSLAITGHSADALIGDSIVAYGDLIHPDDRERIWNTVQNALAAEGHFEAEYRIRCADGSEKWVCERGVGIYGGDEETFLEGFIWDISPRKGSELQRELMSRALAILNRGNDTQRLIGDILRLIKAETHIEAVGIRLHEGDDYPYFETNGLPDRFVEAERHLCACDGSGELILDEDGKPVLECMCGNVIRGRTDAALPFFTDNGSFWTNSTTELLASTTEDDRQAHTRNRCNAAGYESVALIPLTAGDETVGLLQLNDHRRGMFSQDMIRYMEQLSAAIGIALVRQQSAEKLRQREAFNRSLIENSPDCVKILDLEGRLQFMSPGGQRLLEIANIERYLNQQWADFWQGDDHESVVAAIAEARKGGTGRFAGYSPTTTGNPKWWDVIVTPVLDPKGMPVQLLAVSRDVTLQHQAEETRQKLEAQLRQAQKLESIGTLAGGVAHEINNPIMGIMNYAQLIIDQLGPDSPVAEFAVEIGVETQRVATIVKNLLGFARRDEKHSLSMARPLDVVQSTLSLMNAVIRHDQITLTVDVPDDLPAIRCHSQQIQQVLMNLMTNARDALNEKYPEYDENKKILVSGKVVSGEEVGPRSPNARPGAGLAFGEGRPTEGPQPASFLRLTVEDHGSGIAADVREHMFEPFFTTKRPDKGTGLGLSISHGIVKTHGGELHVESEPGQWTRFCIDLPAVPADAP